MTGGEVGESLLFVMPEDGRRYMVVDHACDAQECSAIHLDLVGVDSEDLPIAGLSPIRTSVDADTWQEISGGERSPEERRLVDAFIADLDDQERAFLRERFDASKEETRRIASHTVPVEDVPEGRLVFYTDVISDRRSAFNGGDASAFSITYEGAPATSSARAGAAANTRSAVAGTRRHPER